MRQALVRRLIWALAVVPSACETPDSPDSGTDRPPNVVIVFADDLGYGDLGVQGSATIRTPNLDRLAREGLRFTDFYVSQAVCSASRASLLTGCYADRVGIQGALGPRAKVGLSGGEVTLAELCRSRGYATAIFGKWHLGHREPFLPHHHGFGDSLVVPYSNDMWPWHPRVVPGLPAGLAERKSGFPPLVLYENGAVFDPEVTPEDEARFTELFTQRSVEFIRAHADEPFFLYLAHPMPHVPIFAGGAFEGRSPNGLYADVVEEIDASVGRVLDALEETGVAADTLVLFTSDNGPWLSYGDHAGSAGPLREGKGSSFDGGVRVPCAVRWPRVVEPGSVTSVPAMTIDVLPTVAEVIGAEPPSHRIDGASLLPVLSGATAPVQDAYFFYYADGELQAVRDARFKLHFPHGYWHCEKPGSGGVPGKTSRQEIGLALFDLQADVGETTDVAGAHPDVVARLEALADGMRADLGDKLRGVDPVGARDAGRVED